jgi:hypothetical protein
VGITHDALKSVSSLKEYLVNSFCDGYVSLSDDDVKEIEVIEKEYLKLITNNT